uniref:Uncharacterized protein n=1 Tax=Plectus sambesii TaxID=2011161 RepID=A0A914WXW6_9BILA
MAEERAIQPISKEVAHRICTGQVVSSLAGACKELIDNALDAGATSIDIRLKGYGCDVLEVSDNGSGVTKENLPALCKAHQTSKLRNIDDLVSLNTYGFRGEALNALCALSNMTITTRTASDQLAVRMTFDHRGEAIATEKCPRQPGMTVSVQNLFEPLPVRRKELVNTAKKEYCKLLAMVQSYAIVAVDVRFSCTSMVADKKVVVLSTNGNRSMMDNLCNIFGPKQVTSLLTICHTAPSEQLCHDFGIKDATVFDNFKLTGYISSSEHGQGRSTTDRQFVFINQRPVDFPKANKIVNDVYHQFNRAQAPLLALSIAMPPNFVDVNLSPDKRQVFVTYEKELFALLKSSLLATFDLVASKCTTVSNSNPKFASASSVMANSSTPDRNRATATNGKETAGGQSKASPAKQTDGAQMGKNLKRTREEASSSSTEQKKQSRLEAFSFGAKRSAASENAMEQAALTDVARAEAERLANKSSVPSRPRSPSPSSTADPNALRQVIQRTTVSNLFGLPPGLDDDGAIEDGRSSVSRESGMSSRPSSAFDSRPNSAFDASAMSANGDGRTVSSNLPSAGVNGVQVKIEMASQPPPQPPPADRTFYQVLPSNSNRPMPTSDDQTAVPMTTREDSVKIWRIEQDLPMSMEKLRSRLAETKKKVRDPSPETEGSFSAQLKADDSKTAEAELTRYFLKSDFERMDVIGQFNRGFILARLHDDLFIIDQHASDEKYNFETLQRNARIKTQKLFQPLALELGAIQEIVVQDNVEIFKRNGFEFLFDSNADPGQRVKLTAVPAINDWTFDKNGTLIYK